MPPDGYNTVTLPYNLIETLDGITNLSRAATIRMLVAEYRDGSSSPDDLREQLDRIEHTVADVSNSPDTVTLDAAERRRIAEEVAEVLR